MRSYPDRLVVIVDAPGCDSLNPRFFFLLFLGQLLHVHFDATLHGGLGHVGQRDKVFGVRCEAGRVFHEFAKSASLIRRDVLLVVLDTTDLPHFVLFLLA